MSKWTFDSSSRRRPAAPNDLVSKALFRKRFVQDFPQMLLRIRAAMNVQVAGTCQQSLRFFNTRCQERYLLVQTTIPGSRPGRRVCESVVSTEQRELRRHPG